MTTVLGLILARGGSKRLPGKNLRPLLGVPLVGWTIAVAKQAKSLSLVAVSSDSSDILAFARSCGVRALRRPAQYAADATTSYDTIHFILRTPQYRRYDYVCLLQPTSPFRAPEDVDACVFLARQHGFPALKSVQEGSEVPNGAIYLATPEWLHAGGNWDDVSVPCYAMPEERSLDIDTAEDFAEAERRLAEAGVPTSLISRH